MSAGVSLLERQEAFMQNVLDETAPLPRGWGADQEAGLSVYRGNYRSALMDALSDTFERTKLYVGEGPFAQAAAHHAIGHPPSGWTIDEAGEGFDQTCAQLFANNPEVAELAWLEWTMLALATAPDQAPLDAVGFAEATESLGDAQWSALRLEFQLRMATRIVAHDLTGLWNALSSPNAESSVARLPQGQGCLVWREGERPVFMLTSADDALALTAMLEGASYGEMLLQLAERQTGGDRLSKAIKKAGEFLGQWLQEGMIVRVIA